MFIGRGPKLLKHLYDLSGAGTSPALSCTTVILPLLLVELPEDWGISSKLPACAFVDKFLFNTVC